MWHGRSASPKRGKFFYGTRNPKKQNAASESGNIDSADMGDDFFAKAIRLNVSAELTLAIEHGSCFFVNWSTDAKQLPANIMRVGDRPS
jgi:hypothetical protein